MCASFIKLRTHTSLYAHACPIIDHEGITAPLHTACHSLTASTILINSADYLNVDLNAKTVHEIPRAPEWDAQHDRFALGRGALASIEAVSSSLFT